MKYYKYKSKKNLDKMVIRAQVNCLNNEMKLEYKRYNFWSKFLFFSSMLAWAILLGGLLFIAFTIQNLFVKNIIIITAMILPTLIVGLIAYKISIKLPNKPYLFSYQKRVRHLSCEILRNFYNFNEPFIATKCYKSFNDNFTNHDICLFFYKDNLIITADIYNGFTNISQDLGSYMIDVKDVQVHYEKNGEKLATRLSIGEKSFLLGKRAKRFVETRGILKNKE